MSGSDAAAEGLQPGVRREDESTGGADMHGVRASLSVTLAGSVVFWIGLPWPVVRDFFEAEDEAGRLAVLDEHRLQFAVSFGLLGLGALVAGFGLWRLGRAVAPREAQRSRRRAVAARVAAWLGLLSAAGGASRLAHAVLATPEFILDSPVDAVVGLAGFVATAVALVVLGVLGWSAPPPKWAAVVLVAGGVLGLVTFLPLFWYLALLVFSIASLVVLPRGQARP